MVLFRELESLFSGPRLLVFAVLLISLCFSPSEGIHLLPFPAETENSSLLHFSGDTSLEYEPSLRNSWHKGSDRKEKLGGALYLVTTSDALNDPADTQLTIPGDYSNNHVSCFEVQTPGRAPPAV